MSPPDPHTHPVPAGRLGCWAIRCAAAVGLALSLYLAVASFGHAPLAGCGAGELLDCDHVLGTAWSRWLGIPVALLGAGLYAVLCLLSWWTPQRDTLAGLNAWSLFWFCSVLAVGAGIWFTGLQFISVGKLCIYCLAIHACSLTLAILVGWQVWRPGCSLSSSPNGPSPKRASQGRRTGPKRTQARRANDTRRRLGLATAGALCGLAVLAGGQYFWPASTYQVLDDIALAEPQPLDDDAGATADVAARGPDAASASSSGVEAATFTAKPPDGPMTAAESDKLPAARPPDDHPSQKPSVTRPSAGKTLKPPRRVRLMRGKVTVMPERAPLIGSADAPYIFLEMFDYTCKHCHVMHRYLAAAHERYGDQFAVIVYPVPMDAQCNGMIKKTKQDHVNACKYAQLALAVWSIDKDAFAELHHWMMSAEKTVPLESAIRRAYELVDREELKAVIASRQLQDEMKQYMQLFARIVKGNSGQGRRSLPIVLVQDISLMGVPESADALFRILEERIGLRPLDAASDNL